MPYLCTSWFLKTQVLDHFSNTVVLKVVVTKGKEQNSNSQTLTATIFVEL